MMTLRTYIPLIAIAGLTACAIPDDNTLNRSDLNAFAADDTRALTLDFTPAADIPSGAATYQGHVRSDAIVNGEDDYSIVGLLDLGIDISDTATRAGSGEITGTISQVNLFDDNSDGFEDQEFDGELSISGRASEGRLNANATGVLGAVLSDGPQDTSTWDLTLDGDLRDDFESGDVATGSVAGGTVGSSSDDYDVRLSGGGRFYAERQ